MDYFTSMLYLLISIPVIYLLLSMSKKGRESNPRKPPPGPPGIPIFGNLFGLGTVPHITLAKLAKTYGLLMSLRLGRLSAVVISSPAMAQEAYIKNGIFIYNCYIIDAVCALNHHGKTVGWVPMGRKWRNLRKVCNSQIFSTSKLEATQTIRKKVVQDLVCYLEKSSQDGLAVDTGLAVFTTPLNLLPNTFFSVDLGDPSSKLAVEFREIAQALIGELGGNLMLQIIFLF